MLLTINEQNMLTLKLDPVIVTLHLRKDANEIKEIYQQNHHMLVQAKAMALYHEMIPGAKIGPAPNISLIILFL